MECEIIFSGFQCCSWCPDWNAFPQCKKKAKKKNKCQTTQCKVEDCERVSNVFLQDLEEILEDDFYSDDEKSEAQERKEYILSQTEICCTDDRQVSSSSCTEGQESEAETGCFFATVPPGEDGPPFYIESPPGAKICITMIEMEMPSSSTSEPPSTSSAP